jgi:hypothetical protein
VKGTIRLLDVFRKLHVRFDGAQPDVEPVTLRHHLCTPCNPSSGLLIKVRAARSRNCGAGGTLADVASDRAGC